MRRHYPECDSYLCDGCPRWATCEFAEPLSSGWPRPQDGPRPYPPDVPEPQNATRPRLVYIAGPLSGDETHYLAHVACMLQVWRKLVEAGYVCICPCTDLLLGIVSPGGWPVELYKAHSMELLRHCDVVFVTNPDDISPGVAAEIAEAERLGIAVAYNVAELADGRRDVD